MFLYSLGYRMAVLGHNFSCVCDLERAMLMLLKSVLEIQLTKGLPMEQFFPSWPRTSDIGESINQLVRGTKA